jgi:hypothetical protein
MKPVGQRGRPLPEPHANRLRRWAARLGNLFAVLAGLLQAAVGLAILFLPLFGTCEPTLGSVGDAASSAPDGGCVRYAYAEYGNATGYQLLLTLAALGLAVALSTLLPPNLRGGVRWGCALFGVPASLASFALGWVLLPVALLTLSAVAVAEATQ